MKNREDVENEELENFDEAMKAVITVLEPTKVPTKTQNIISDQNCISLHKKSSDFWIMARGLKDFIDEKNILPVRGSIPGIKLFYDLIFSCRAKPAVSLVTTFGKIFVVLSGHILFVVLSRRFLICRPVWSFPNFNHKMSFTSKFSCLPEGLSLHSISIA